MSGLFFYTLQHLPTLKTSFANAWGVFKTNPILGPSSIIGISMCVTPLKETKKHEFSLNLDNHCYKKINKQINNIYINKQTENNNCCWFNLNFLEKYYLFKHNVKKICLYITYVDSPSFRNQLRINIKM